MNPPESFDFMAWLDGAPGHSPETIDPVLKQVMEKMRGEMGVRRVGAVGYCFGGKYVVRGLAKGGGIDVGYIAHPSFVDAEELARIDGPLSISAAGKRSKSSSISFVVFDQDQRMLTRPYAG